MIKMKPLLKESIWTNRKFGESLPTLEDYMSETYDDENCSDGHAVVSEADDDDKYVSIGWGKYKEKGKEDDKTAPTFKKTDDGKYIKGKDDEKGEFTPDKEEKPEKEPAGKLGGGDFERDFDDDEDEYPDKDPINTKKGEMEDEMEDIASELDNVTDPDERKELEDRYDELDQELYAINKKQYGDDSGYEPFTDDPDDIDDLPDTTGGDPDDSWDDEEGRAKPSGKTDADEDDYDMGVVPGSRELDDTPEDDSEKGSSLTSAPGRRPGGEQAEIDYQKADQMIKKYAGRDIEKAEFWAKKKKQAADAMVGEITINGKKYKPITESINPTIFDPHNEIKRMLNKISTRQFDRKWKKEII